MRLATFDHDGESLGVMRYAYSNGRVAILVEAANDEAFADVSVNVVAVQLAEGEFVIHHDLDSDLRQKLRDTGLFEDTGRTVSYGYVTGAEIWRLKLASALVPGRIYKYSVLGLARAAPTAGRDIARSLRFVARSATRVAYTDAPLDAEGFEVDPVCYEPLDYAIHLAFNEGLIYEVDGDRIGERATLAEIVVPNARDEAVCDFIRDELLALAVGESCVYDGGAGGCTTFKRVR